MCLRARVNIFDQFLLFEMIEYLMILFVAFKKTLQMERVVNTLDNDKRI